MEKKKILSSLIVGSMIISATIPSVLAQTYNNDDQVDKVSSYGVDTTYEAVGYQSAVETYNIDLEWDDLHWVYVYEGDIKSPNASIWVAKEYYDNANKTPEEIIENIDSWLDKDRRELTVTNNSGFSVNVLASIENKTSANYANSANLQIGRNSDEIIFSNSAKIDNLMDKASESFVVKPTSKDFVNNTGTTTSVTGEVNLTFTKYNY